MTYPFGEVVTIVHRTATPGGPDGNDVLLETSRVTVTAALAPGAATENADMREQTFTGLTAYGMPDTVTALDQVIARGSTWDVQGDPEPFLSPFTGWRPGCVVSLIRVEG